LTEVKLKSQNRPRTHSRNWLCSMFITWPKSS